MLKYLALASTISAVFSVYTAYMAATIHAPFCIPGGP